MRLYSPYHGADSPFLSERTNKRGLFPMHSRRTINTQIDPRGQEQTVARSYVPTLMFRLQRSQKPMAMSMLKKGTLYVVDIM